MYRNGSAIPQTPPISYQAIGNGARDSALCSREMSLVSVGLALVAAVAGEAPRGSPAAAVAGEDLNGSSLVFLADVHLGEGCALSGWLGCVRACVRACALRPYTYVWSGGWVCAVPAVGACTAIGRRGRVISHRGVVAAVASRGRSEKIWTAAHQTKPSQKRPNGSSPPQEVRRRWESSAESMMVPIDKTSTAFAN